MKKWGMSNGIERRAQIDGETAKALLLINGGGAIALLSLFSTIVGKPGSEPLVWSILVSVFLMMLGLIFGVLHNYYRRQCSLQYEHHNMRPPKGVLLGFTLPEPRICFLSRVLLWASLLSFASAGGYVAYTGLRNIDQLHKLGTAQPTLPNPAEKKK